jgi:hypothetical protein
MKLIDWVLGLFGTKKDDALDAWPFPVVLGTPPAFKEAPVKKKRGRPALKKATTRKAAVKKPVKKSTKKVK